MPQADQIPAISGKEQARVSLKRRRPISNGTGTDALDSLSPEEALVAEERAYQRSLRDRERYAHRERAETEDFKKKRENLVAVEQIFGRRNRTSLEIAQDEEMDRFMGASIVIDEEEPPEAAKTRRSSIRNGKSVAESSCEPEHVPQQCPICAAGLVLDAPVAGAEIASTADCDGGGSSTSKCNGLQKEETNGDDLWVPWFDEIKRRRPQNRQANARFTERYRRGLLREDSSSGGASSEEPIVPAPSSSSNYSMRRSSQVEAPSNGHRGGVGAPTSNGTHAHANGGSSAVLIKRSHKKKAPEASSSTMSTSSSHKKKVPSNDSGTHSGSGMNSGATGSSVTEKRSHKKKVPDSEGGTSAAVHSTVVVNKSHKKKVPDTTPASVVPTNKHTHTHAHTQPQQKASSSAPPTRILPGRAARGERVQTSVNIAPPVPAVAERRASLRHVGSPAPPGNVGSSNTQTDSKPLAAKRRSNDEEVGEHAQQPKRLKTAASGAAPDVDGGGSSKDSGSVGTLRRGRSASVSHVSVGPPTSPRPIVKKTTSTKGKETAAGDSLAPIETKGSTKGSSSVGTSAFEARLSPRLHKNTSQVKNASNIDNSTVAIKKSHKKKVPDTFSVSVGSTSVANIQTHTHTHAQPQQKPPSSAPPTRILPGRAARGERVQTSVNLAPPVPPPPQAVAPPVAERRASLRHVGSPAAPHNVGSGSNDEGGGGGAQSHKRLKTGSSTTSTDKLDVDVGGSLNDTGSVTTVRRGRSASVSVSQSSLQPASPRPAVVKAAGTKGKERATDVNSAPIETEDTNTQSSSSIATRDGAVGSGVHSRTTHASNAPVETRNVSVSASSSNVSAGSSSHVPPALEPRISPRLHSSTRARKASDGLPIIETTTAEPSNSSADVLAPRLSPRLHRNTRVSNASIETRDSTQSSTSVGNSANMSNGAGQAHVPTSSARVSSRLHSHTAHVSNASIETRDSTHTQSSISTQIRSVSASMPPPASSPRLRSHATHVSGTPIETGEGSASISSKTSRPGTHISHTAPVNNAPMETRGGAHGGSSTAAGRAAHLSVSIPPPTSPRVHAPTNNAHPPIETKDVSVSVGSSSVGSSAHVSTLAPRMSPRVHTDTHTNSASIDTRNSTSSSGSSSTSAPRESPRLHTHSHATHASNAPVEMRDGSGSVSSGSADVLAPRLSPRLHSNTRVSNAPIGVAGNSANTSNSHTAHIGTGGNASGNSSAGSSALVSTQAARFSPRLHSTHRSGSGSSARPGTHHLSVSIPQPSPRHAAHMNTAPADARNYSVSVGGTSSHVSTQASRVSPRAHTHTHTTHASNAPIETIDRSASSASAHVSNAPIETRGSASGSSSGGSSSSHVSTQASRVSPRLHSNTHVNNVSTGTTNDSANTGQAHVPTRVSPRLHTHTRTSNAPIETRDNSVSVGGSSAVPAQSPRLRSHANQLRVAMANEGSSSNGDIPQSTVSTVSTAARRSTAHVPTFIMPAAPASVEGGSCVPIVNSSTNGVSANSHAQSSDDSEDESERFGSSSTSPSSLNRTGASTSSVPQNGVGAASPRATQPADGVEVPPASIPAGTSSVNNEPEESAAPALSLQNSSAASLAATRGRRSNAGKRALVVDTTSLPVSSIPHTHTHTNTHANTHTHTNINANASGDVPAVETSSSSYGTTHCNGGGSSGHNTRHGASSSGTGGGGSGSSYDANGSTHVDGQTGSRHAAVSELSGTRVDQDTSVEDSSVQGTAVEGDVPQTWYQRFISKVSPRNRSGGA